jgi:hypothetical protein
MALESKTMARIAAAATAVSAAALVAHPVFAHAYPMIPLTPVGPCKFVGVQVLDLDNGLEVILPSAGTTIQGDGFYSHPGQNDTQKGVVNGTLNGTAVDIHATWSGPFLFSHFTGQVNDDHTASGTVTNSNGNNDTTGWHTKFADRISCAKQPAPPPPPPPPPPPALTATANADTDLYDKPSDQGGHVIGMINKGQTVKVVKACSHDAWCALTDPAGAVWGRDLTNDPRPTTLPTP